MADVAIKYKPDVKPTISAPKREANGSHSMTAKWSPGTWYRSGSNDRRITGWEIQFKLYCRSHRDRSKTKVITYEKTSGNVSRTDWTLNLNNFKAGGVSYTRDSFYPNGDLEITSVKAALRAYNTKGKGPWVSATSNFAQPRKPSIVMEQDESTGDVTFKVKHDKGQDMREIWNTRVWHDVWDNSKPVEDRQIEVGTNYFGTNETEHTYSCDVFDRMGKTYDQYVCVTARATSRGYWGDSEECVAKLFVSWPRVPTTAVDVSGRAVNDKVTVRLDLNGDTQHPVTGVKLEKLVNVDYSDASKIPGDADWMECGSEDDGQCTALSSTVAELIPEVGKRTWVRVKSWNQVEGIFYTHSVPQEIVELHVEAPTAADDSVRILEALSGDDGESASVLLAWGDDDGDGTELSWSDYAKVWKSTEDPHTKLIDDATHDEGPVTRGSETWAHSTLVYIPGLEHGKACHVRARRYRQTDDKPEYGLYYPADGGISVMPTTSPTSVSLTAPTSVPRGQSLPLSWTFDGNGEQRWWELMAGPATVVEEEVPTWPDPQGDPVIELVERLVLDGSTRVVARGDDANGSVSIPFDRVESVLGAASDPSGDTVAAFAVVVSTGGTPVQSDAVGVTVADPPTVSVAARTVGAQPMALEVESDSQCSVSVVVRSLGASRRTPSGMRDQAEGDLVWSSVASPDWEGSEGSWSASLAAPMGLDLVDGASYHVRVVATDDATGLDSEPAECDFTVDYERKAPEPGDGVTVSPYDVTDADSGARTRGCTIALAQPDGYEDSDSIDLYRSTLDGVDLVASGLPADAVVDDPYAPFGDGAGLAYVVSVRTADGCEEWRSYPYELGGGDLRVDFEGPFGPEYVELPYNLAISDSWSKGFEAREHLDGTVGGYWSPAVVRNARLSTDAIRVGDGATMASVAALASSAAPCWVRTPAGQAYQADVQCTVGPVGPGGAPASVALDASGVTRTGFGVTVSQGDGEGDEDTEGE